jgi:hypothetical protein
MDDDISLDEQFENVTTRWGDWEGYVRDYYLKLDQKQRANELLLFDRALHHEAVHPRKEFAEHWVRRRELGRLDDIMKRAGR